MTNKLKSKSQKGGSKSKLQQKGGNFGGASDASETSNEKSFFRSKTLYIIIIILLVVLLISLYAKWYSSSYLIYNEVKETEEPKPTLFTRPYYYFADFIYPGYYDSYYNTYPSRYYNNYNNRPYPRTHYEGGHMPPREHDRGGRGDEHRGGHDGGDKSDDDGMTMIVKIMM